MCDFQSYYKFIPQLLELAWHFTVAIKHSHQNYSGGSYKDKDTCCVKIPWIIWTLDVSGSMSPSHRKQDTPPVKYSFEAHVIRQNTQTSNSKKMVRKNTFPWEIFLFLLRNRHLTKGKLWCTSVPMPPLSGRDRN